jgi:hypothetical protein
MHVTEPFAHLGGICESIGSGFIIVGEILSHDDTLHVLAHAFA